MTSGIEDDGGDNDDDAGDDKNRIKLYLSKIVYGFGELSLHTHTPIVIACIRNVRCGREIARAHDYGWGANTQAKAVTIIACRDNDSKTIFSPRFCLSIKIYRANKFRALFLCLSVCCVLTS